MRVSPCVTRHATNPHAAAPAGRRIGLRLPATRTPSGDYFFVVVVVAWMLVVVVVVGGDADAAAAARLDRRATSADCTFAVT